jgi:hypothetical protein
MFWRKQTIECVNCGGTGNVQTRKGEKDCPKCQGSGKQIRVNPLIGWVLFAIVVIVFLWLVFIRPEQTQAVVNTPLIQENQQEVYQNLPQSIPSINTGEKTFTYYMKEVAVAFYIASGLPAFAALLVLEGIATIIVFIVTSALLRKAPASMFKFAMKIAISITIVYIWYSAGVSIGGWVLFFSGAIPNLIVLGIVWGYAFNYSDGSESDFNEGEIVSYRTRRKLSLNPSRDDNN